MLTIVKKFCCICNTNAAVFICDGCQQNFCGKHVGDHRQHLNSQLDQLVQEKELLHAEFQQPFAEKDLSFKEIDQWERETINEIQRLAQTARDDLGCIRNKSTERLKNSFENLSTIFSASREADDFSENDLHQWSNELQRMKSEIIAPSTAKIVYEQNSTIRSLRVTTEVAEVSLPIPPVPLVQVNDVNYDARERFAELYGSGTITEQSLLATHTGSTKEYVYFRGHLLYSEKCFGIRLRVEKFQKPYEIFLGFTSIQSSIEEIPFRSKSTIGWAGFNQTFINGRYDSNVKKHRYYSTKIQRKDVMSIMFDHEKKQIRLRNERTKITNVLWVDKKLVQGFWQFLVVLASPGDSIRILTHM